MPTAKLNVPVRVTGNPYAPDTHKTFFQLLPVELDLLKRIAYALGASQSTALRECLHTFAKAPERDIRKGLRLAMDSQPGRGDARKSYKAGHFYGTDEDIRTRDELLEKIKKDSKFDSSESIHWQTIYRAAILMMPKIRKDVQRAMPLNPNKKRRKK